MSQAEDIHRVVEVEPLGGFTLRLRFEDDQERILDLEEELWGPVFEPLKEDPALFRQVRVDPVGGTVVWPGGADMDPDVLYGSREPARPGVPRT